MTKSNLLPFRRTPKFERDVRPPAEGKLSRAGHRSRRRSLAAIVSASIIAVGGWVAYGGADNLLGLIAMAKIPTTDSLSAAFSFCGSERRFNCVVDGDTFW